jgi:hypothetical protein
MNAEPCYYAGGPFVALWTTVDRGDGKIEIEVDCPIIDKTKASTENGWQ